MPTEDTTKESTTNLLKDAAKIAAGMIRDDWPKLLWLYAVMITPRFLSSLFPTFFFDWILIIRLIERVTYLAVFAIISRSWLNRMGLQIKNFNLQVVLIGLGLWLSYMLPVIGQFASWSLELKFFLLFWLIPGVYFNIKYFFYFQPLMLGTSNISQALKESAEYTAKDRYLGLKSCIGPAGVLFLANALIQAISPDGRYHIVTYIADLFSGLMWILTSYLSIALGIMLTPNTTWQKLGLDPYKTSYLASLAVRGSKILAACFLPNKGLTMFALAGLIWAGNIMQLAQLPPAASISVNNISIENSSIIIEINAQDPKYSFRGFSPVFFALASDQRTVLAAFPSKAVLSDSREDALLLVKSQDPDTNIRLTFATNRKAENIKELDDLYLWYRNSKLLKLDTRAAQIVVTNNPTTEDSSAN